MSTQGRMFGPGEPAAVGAVRPLALSVPLDAVVEALGMPRDDVLAFFRDGRVATPFFERLIASRLGLWLSKAEGGAQRLTDAQGGEWEVRSLSGEGVGFAASKLVGTQRVFDRERFEARAREVVGYFVVDAASFPVSRAWAIPSATVLEWTAHDGRGRLSRAEFLAFAREA